MDIIYFDNDYELAREFKESFIKRFPENNLESTDDDIHGARVVIYYESITEEIVMKWMIKNGWFRFSLTFGSACILRKDDERYKQLLKWIMEVKEEGK